MKHILEALRDGIYRYTVHARKQMSIRNFIDNDVRSCGETGEAFINKDNQIEVWGITVDNDPITVICVEDNGILIITVFGDR